MFSKKFLQTTALTICSAFIIGISDGTAQASVAEQSLMAPEVQSTVFVYSGNDTLRSINRATERERKRQEWHQRHNRDRYYDRGYDRSDYPPRHRH